MRRSTLKVYCSLSKWFFIIKYLHPTAMERNVAPWNIILLWCDTYTLFHEKNITFFSNIIGLPERRNKRKSVLEITKMYYF